MHFILALTEQVSKSHRECFAKIVSDRMQLSGSITETHHRPWTLPSGAWKFYQEWKDVIFLHWVVDESLLRPFVPKTLELDFFEGKAWVSLVAFDMRNTRPRLIPAIPPLSNFSEVNIRTYVRAAGKAGVYFLSIEASKKGSAWIARSISGLPYRYSSISRTLESYHSKNVTLGDEFSINFQIGKRMEEKDVIDKWLSERYALFQDSVSGSYMVEIHHQEWPLRTLNVDMLVCHYPRFEEVLAGKPDMTHYSHGVKVMAWERQKLK